MLRPQGEGGERINEKKQRPSLVMSHLAREKKQGTQGNSELQKPHSLRQHWAEGCEILL